MRYLILGIALICASQSYSKVIESTFLQLGEFGKGDEKEVLKWKSADWRRGFTYMKEIGINEIIIQWTVHEYRDPLNYDSILSDSSLFPKPYLSSSLSWIDAPKVDFDLIDTILTVCDSMGIKAYLGLLGECHMQMPYREPEQLNTYKNQCIDVANELYQRYDSRHPLSFQGWYIPYELNNWIEHPSMEDRISYLDQLGPYWTQIASTCHSLNGKPVLISPYFRPESLTTFSQWSNIFASHCKDWGIDTVLFMDCVGSRLCPLELVGTYFSLIKTAFDNNSLPFWADLETFQDTTVWDSWESDSDTIGMPTNINRVIAQMDTNFKYVDKIVTFEYNYFMNPARSLPTPGSYFDYRIRASKLYDDYRNHFWGTGNAAYQKSYTFSRPPHPDYPDTGLTKLTDGSLGKEWNRFVGWSGSMDSIEITINLGEMRRVRNIRIYTINDTISAAAYAPDSIRLYGSTDDTDYTYLGSARGFKFDGALLPFCWSDSNSQIETQFLKCVVPPYNTDWTMISEIMIFDGSYLSASSNVTADAISYDKIVLQWTDNSELNTNYEIRYKPESGNWDTLTVGDITINTITGLTSGQKYYLEVRAADDKGNFSAWADTFEYSIPMWSDDSCATAFNNGRRILVKGDSVYVLWDKSGKILFAKSGDGVTWSLDEEIGTGKYGAMAFDKDSGINVCWIGNDGLKYRRNGATYFGTIVPYVSGRSFAPPGISIGNDDTVRIAVQYSDAGIPPASGTVYVWYYGFPITSPASKDSLLLDSWGGGTPQYSPSIALYGSEPKVCWEKGNKIYYREYSGGWLDTVVIDSGVHPSIDAHDGYVRIIYENDNNIWLKAKHSDSTLWRDSLNLPSDSSLAPQIYGSIGIWSQESGGQYDVYASSMTALGGVFNLSNSSPASKNPQLAIKQGDTLYIYYLWTEGDNLPYDIRVNSIATKIHKPTNHITDDMVIPAGEILMLCGNCTIDPDVSVVINQGATVYCENLGDEKGQITIKGSLLAQAAAFTSDSSGGSSKWQGMVIDTGGSAELRGCTIKNAGCAIATKGTVLAVNNIITDNDTGICILENAGLVCLGDLRDTCTSNDGFNSIYNNTVWNLINNTQDTVIAQANWWSDTSKINGIVLKDPPGKDWQGENWVIANDSTIYGSHWRIGTFRINPGKTVKVAPRSINTTGWIAIDADSIEIPSQSILSADSAGYSSDGPGSAEMGASSKGASGGALGGRSGWGGSNIQGDTSYSSAGGSYGSIANCCEMGSGGGASDVTFTYPATVGGGILRINCSGTTVINGTLKSNGEPGQGSYNKASGGASGGSIWVVTKNLSGAGSILACGGAGGNGANWTDGGSGSGGRVHIKFSDNSTFSGRIDVSAGESFYNATSGQPGSILIQQGNLDRALLSPVNTANTQNSRYGFIKGVEITNWICLSSGDSIVGNINLTADSIVINSGSYIIADNKGYSQGYGEGAGHSGSSGHGGGAGSHFTNGGHGSYFTEGSTGDCGETYDDTLNPDILGSGGGCWSSTAFWGGGSGGGKVTLNSPSGRILINGNISANASAGTSKTSYAGGGGSGGSILIYANVLDGTGTISANGANGGAVSGCYGGGGAGGLIAVYRDNNSFTGTVSVDSGVKGGGNATDGKPGVIHIDTIPKSGGSQTSGIIPLVFKLYPAYPNPSNRMTTIKYEIPVTSKVSLKLYDLSGRCVKTLVDGETRLPGCYKTELKSEDYPTGIYFAKYIAGKYRETKKLVLMK